MRQLSKVLFILQFVAAAVAETERCDSSVCNDEGVCQLEGGVARCDCIGSGYFRGPFCDQPVDNCSPNPCRNGAACTSTIGQYVCGPCPAGMAGQRCSVRASGALFTRLHLLFNHMAFAGVQQHFLLTVESLGDQPFTHEIIADTAVVAAVETAPPAFSSKALGCWVRSNDLPRAARKLGLRNADSLPYTSGYYCLAKVIFWREGTQTVSLIAHHEDTLYASADFALRVLRRKSTACQPDIAFPHCANPRKPLFVDVARFNNFEPLVRTRCSGHLSFEWAVTDQTETVMLHHFGRTASTLLKIRPYLLAFAHRGSIMQSYMIQLKIRERGGRNRLLSVARCFVFVLPKPVQAVIDGGTRRSVPARRQFVVDGSRSRDFALSPRVAQDMDFSWRCSSPDDAANHYCQSGSLAAAKGRSLTVPAGALQLGKTYTFALIVTSLVNIYSSHEARQAVTPVEGQPLDVDIACVRNCADDRFAPGQLLHLEARCRGCPAGEATTYAWTVNGAAQEGRRLLRTPTSADAQLSVELTVSARGRQGTASRTYSKNAPPQGAGCTVEPASGVEFETAFYIVCQDYREAPLSYQFMAGDFTLDRTNENATHLHLPQVGSVAVVVCDFFLACTETSVAVGVAAMAVPEDAAGIQHYLARYNTTLHGLLEDGDIERAMVFVKALTKAAASVPVATLGYLLDEMREFQLATLQEIEQFAVITRDLVAALKPIDHAEAALIARYLRKLTAGCRYVVGDGEIHDMLASRHVALSQQLADMLAELSVEWDPVPELQTLRPQHVTAADGIAETYPDFDDIDAAVLERVDDWLQASRELHSFLYYMGLAATMGHHEPTEPPLLTASSEGIQLQAFRIESTEPYNFTTADQKTTVSLGPAVLAALQSQLGDPHVLLQFVAMQHNPFWWCPDEHQPSTPVVYVSAYSQAARLGQAFVVPQPVVVETQLQPPVRNERSLDPVTVILNGSHDMPIFSATVPRGALLRAKFLQTNSSLRVVFRLGAIPRSCQVRRSAQRVSATSTGETFRVFNQGQAPATAYLAVLSADAGDTSRSCQFVLEQRECVSWRFDFDRPRWSSDGCSPVLESGGTDRFRCRCSHLSAFAGKEYAIPAVELVRDRHLLKHIPISLAQIVFVVLLLLVLLLLLRRALQQQEQAMEFLVLDVYDCDARAPYNTLVRIHTAALSTSNIFLLIQTSSGMRQYCICQPPAEPVLTQSSTCAVRLPLSYTHIELPMKIEVYQDNAGRYPTWHCAAIDVIDLTSGLYTHMVVDRWITSDELDTLEEGGDANRESTKFAVFGRQLERNFINWFQFQPLAGPWESYLRQRQLNRYERTCIWISKFVVTCCIVTCYFGPTTLETYEEERERYFVVEFRPAEILGLGLVASAAGVAIEQAFRYQIFQ